MKRKSLLFIVIALMAGLIMTSCGGNSSNDTDGETSSCQLSLEVTYKENFMFDLFDVDVFVDGNRIGRIRQGNTFTNTVKVPKGKVVILFKNSNEDAVQKGEIELNVKEDETFRCTIIAGKEISIKDVKEDEFEQLERTGDQDMVEESEKMTNHIIEGANLSELKEAIIKDRDLKWTSMADGYCAQKYEDDHTYPLIDAYIHTDRLDGSKVWAVEIRSNNNEGDYSIFYDAINVIHPNEASSEELRKWFDETVNELRKKERGSDQSITLGDVICYLTVYGDGDTRDVELIIKGVGWTSYRNGGK